MLAHETVSLSWKRTGWRLARESSEASGHPRRPEAIIRTLLPGKQRDDIVSIDDDQHVRSPWRPLAGQDDLIEVKRCRNLRNPFGVVCPPVACRQRFPRIVLKAEEESLWRVLFNFDLCHQSS